MNFDRMITCLAGSMAGSVHIVQEKDGECATSLPPGPGILWLCSAGRPLAGIEYPGALG